MKELKEKIKEEGEVLSEHVLKVDRFLNHQIDPAFMNQIGRELAARFYDEPITKVLTVESSGIAPALMTGLHLHVPVIFARKKASLTMTDVYQAQIFSYTKQSPYTISVAKSLLGEDDTVLIIDDFLANGTAVKGMLEIVAQARARISGIGIVIEKSFQSGGRELRRSGYRVESLVQIASLHNQTVQYLENGVDEK